VANLVEWTGMTSRGRVLVTKPNFTGNAMPSNQLATFLGLVEEIFRPALTRPGFANLLVLLGWLLCHGPVHTITEALVASGVAGQCHHEAFHRLFSRGAWSPDTVGSTLLRHLLKRSASEPLRVVLDDTLASKKGPHIFGLGTHVDAVRSTRRWRIFSFGHCWLVLSVLVRVPFSSRPWALPFLFRLYRNRDDCASHNDPYQKKTELAREMLTLLCAWTGETPIELALDSAYCNETVLRSLPLRVTVFGTMRPDAVLTAAPEPPRAGQRRGGRPAKRGPKKPKPQEVARDEQSPWRRCKAFLYGQVRTIRYKTLDAQWYRVCGDRLLRIVIVETSTGERPFRVFFCTDPTLAIATILEGYAGRWNIEVFFRDAKQWLGFADSPARTEGAVLRMAPFVGLVYSTLVLWFAEGAYQSPLAAPPVRPWYRHKKSMSFADILRAAQRMLSTIDVLALSCDYGKLRNRAVNRATPEKRNLPLAA
jgi:hypothetical protein